MGEENRTDPHKDCCGSIQENTHHHDDHEHEYDGHDHGHHEHGHDHHDHGHHEHGHDGREHDHCHHVHDPGCNCPDCAGVEEIPEKLKVTSLFQDEAVVISAEYHVTVSRDRLGRLMEEKLAALASLVNERGGIIGHIKASVEIMDVELYSVTDVEVMRKESRVCAITVHFAAIVFLLEERDLRLLVEEMFGTMDLELQQQAER